MSIEREYWKALSLIQRRSSTPISVEEAAIIAWVEGRVGFLKIKAAEKIKERK